jgi:hypothetical protein
LFPVLEKKAAPIAASFDIDLDRKAWAKLSRVQRAALLDAHETGDKWQIRSILGPDWATPPIEATTYDDGDRPPADPDVTLAECRDELLRAGIPQKIRRRREYFWSPPKKSAAE